MKVENEVFFHNFCLCLLAILLARKVEPWWISFGCLLFLERVRPHE